MRNAQRKVNRKYTSGGRCHSALIVSNVAVRFFLIRYSSTTILQKVSKMASVEAPSLAIVEFIVVANLFWSADSRNG
jgi:hypothetical protein